jgi:hypothetical protein
LADPENPNGLKLTHFGDLCCCKGTVDGITNYNLPQELKELYTSSDASAILFRNDAPTFNNGMAMNSLTAQHGWQSRGHNKKMDATLTSGGQLFRRFGSLHPVDGERPKCVQTISYGGAEATIRKNLNPGKKTFLFILDGAMRYFNMMFQTHKSLKQMGGMLLQPGLFCMKQLLT